MGKRHLSKDLYPRFFFIKSQNQFMQAGYTLAPNKQRKQISQAVLEVELLPHFIELMMMMCFLLSTDKNHQSDKVFYRLCIMKIRLFIFQYASALRHDVLNSIKNCIYLVWPYMFYIFYLLMTTSLVDNCNLYSNVYYQHLHDNNKIP